jgi:two-component system, chemotaxis family, sensor kinase CheA
MHDPSLLAVFRDELDDLAARLEQAGVALGRAWDDARIDEAFRALHTLKGNALSLGYAGMGALMHEGEAALLRLRAAGGAAADAAAIGDLLLDVTDAIRRMAADPAAAAPPALLARLMELAADAAPVPAAAGPDASPAAGPDARLPAAPPPDAEAREALTIPVGIAELDALFSSLGGLRAGLLNRGETALARRAEELARMLLAVRKMPVERLATRLHRVARETSRAVERPARLVVDGEGLHADAAVVQDLATVLPHMIRNAIDHGLEPEADRVRRGKPAEGTVRLRFVQEHGAFVVVVEDDGRGMDPEQIAASAVRRGLIAADEAARLSDEERLQLIFRPGLSTRERVTEVSGRGVGMDVVAAVVRRHRGRTGIASEPGRGTRFELRFPVLFRWEEYLVVELDHREVGLPVRHVREVLPAGLAPEEVPRTGTARRGGVTMPLLAFRDLDPRAGATAGRPAVVLELEDGRAVLPVDRLAGFAATLVQALPGRHAPHLAGIGQTAAGGILWGIDLDEVSRRPAAYRLEEGAEP